MFPGSNVSRALARANPDWIMVDCEHGNIDGASSQARSNGRMLTWRADAAMHEAVPAIAACGISPCVRIPDLQSWMIKSEAPIDH